MSLRESIHGRWSSPLSFIVVGAGAAIGFSNFWGLPPLIAQYGGGAFLLIYLGFLIVLGLPLLSCELLLGRRARQSPVNTLYLLAISAHQHPAWKYLGALCVLTVVLVLSYYSVIYGWALGYMFRSLIGTFDDETIQGVSMIFVTFVSNPEVLFAWHTVFMGVTIIIVARGIDGGIQRVARPLMYTLLTILLILLGYTMYIEQLGSSLLRLLSMDFSVITTKAVFEAMKLALFSASVGMGVFIVYGAYLSNKTAILRSSAFVLGVDLLVALAAALIVYSLLQANDMGITRGEKLVFQTLPYSFGQMTGGVVWGTLFFIVMVCAAWTSSIALLETAVSWVIERFGLKRLHSTFILGGTVWLLGILTTLSFYQESPLRFVFKYAGQKREFGLFNLFEVVTANILLPTIAFGTALFCAWFMSSDAVRHELNIRSRVVYTLWRGLVGFIIPFLIVLIFLDMNGLMRVE